MASLIFDLGLTEKTVNRDWTFKDLSVDIEKTSDNKDIKVSKDSLAIQNGIKNMFLFSKGERIINPEFGNNIYKYIYETVTDLTARKIDREIREMFDRWEPRVSLDDIEVIPHEDQNTYYIEINYSIPSLSNNSLVFKTAVNARRGT